MTTARSRLRMPLALLAVGGSSFCVLPLAGAGTLDQAIQTATQTNPVLAARREAAAAAKESINLAYSGFYPKVVLSGSAGISNQTATGITSLTPVLSPALDKNRRTLGLGAELVQPVFDGFRTWNAADEAIEMAAAEDKEVSAMTAQVRLDAVRLFMTVIAGRSNVALLKQAVSMLEADLNLARKQLQANEATRIDIEQLVARIAEAKGVVSSAQAALAASEGTYEQTIGEPPAALASPKAQDTGLPFSLDRALELAAHDNPAISAARHRELAARRTIAKIEADYLPRIDLRVSYNRSFDNPATVSDPNAAEVLVQASLPISVGGETLARARQARATLRQRQQETRARIAEVRAQVRSAWARLAAARERAKLGAAGVSSGETVLAGVRIQRKAGDKTTLDVINAQRDLVMMKQQQIETRSELIIAAYEVLTWSGTR